MDKKKTGSLIKEARTKKNYTQNELGDLLGISNKAVSRWENGESFPDVGILENLAAVLDLRIQDIVTGDAAVNHDGVVDEVLRIARLQQKELKRKAVRTTFLIAAILFCFISGCLAFGNNRICDSIYIYAIFMCFSFALILACCTWQNETEKEPNKFVKYSKIVSLLSFLWSIVLTWWIFITIINGHIPFGMRASSVGLFLNWQLIGLFTLNLIINICEIYRYERCDEAIQIHWGWFVSIGTMYLTDLYSDLLHRMDYAQGAIESLQLRTIVVIFITGISLILAKRSHLRKD